MRTFEHVVADPNWSHDLTPISGRSAESEATEPSPGAIMIDEMPDFLAYHGTPLRPFSTEDLEWLRAKGRPDEPSDDLCQRAVRLQLLRATGCLPTEAEASKGAERTEVAALCGLALEPARSHSEHCLKRTLFASVPGDRRDNLSTMLAASVEADAARLAVADTRALPTESSRPGGYEHYIASPAWRSSPARQLELLMSERRCRICDRGEPEVGVEVHHRTYVRLGRERASDLCTLCRECHQLATAELRRRRFAARAVPTPRDTPRATPTIALRDGVAHLGGQRRG